MARRIYANDAATVTRYAFVFGALFGAAVVLLIWAITEVL